MKKLILILLLISIKAYGYYYTWWVNFDTSVSIKVYDDIPEEKFWRLVFQVQKILSNFEKQFSWQRMQNVFSKKNDYVVLTKEEKKLLNLAKKYYFINPKFNLLVGKISLLWGFKNNKFKIPNRNVLKNTVKEILEYSKKFYKSDYESLKDLKNDLGIFPDLGAIAKGYAIDKAAEFLKNEVKNFILEAGGDLVVYGSREFRIGIKHPREKGLLAVIDVNKPCAIATSGDYERFFIRNSRRYCHIISPFTGYPADFNMSVTVVSNTLTDADALATLMFLQTATESLKLADRLKVAVLIVDKNGKIYMNDKMKKLVKINAFATKKDVYFVFVLFLIFVGFIIYVKFFYSAKTLLILTDNSKIEYKLPVWKVVKVKGKIGISVIEIKGKKVRFLDSPCPDKVCVNSGWITSGSVVCIPNEVQVIIKNSDEKLDFVSW